MVVADIRANGLSFETLKQAEESTRRGQRISTAA